MNEMKIEYKDILDIECALRLAEIKAKREWDNVVKWREPDQADGGVLYAIHHDTVKELRSAQKKLRILWTVIKESNIEQVYTV
jgi:hypothetical protein